MTAISFLVIGLLSLVLYKLYNAFNKRKEFYSKFNKFPGPKGRFFFGNALEFRSSADTISKLMQYQKEHGLTFRLHFGSRPYIFTADANIIEAITTSSTQINKSLLYKFLSNWIGNGLVSATNPRWKHHRRLITPTFHFNILKDFIPTFHKNAKQLETHWKARIGKQQSQRIDVYEDVLASALDVICETAMGIEVNALRDGKRSMYIKSVKFMGENVINRAISSWKHLDCLYQQTSIYKTELKMVAIIKKTTEEVINRKRQELLNPTSKSTAYEDGGVGIKKRTAFLDHLLASMVENGGFMSDKDLREEVDTFIFAGHDTVASTLSFLLYNLAEHSEVQEKLYEEVVTVLDGEDNMAFEKLSSLKYMDMVIKESMRVFPTVPVIQRVLFEDLVCSNGQVIPKGTNLALFIYGLSRNANVFENPELFDPERFNPSNAGKYGTFAYVPFSAGPRNCIGQKFALLEIKSLLSTLVKEFKFTNPEGFKVQLVDEILLKSSNGIHLYIETRK